MKNSPQLRSGPRKKPNTTGTKILFAGGIIALAAVMSGKYKDCLGESNKAAETEKLSTESSAAGSLNVETNLNEDPNDPINQMFNSIRVNRETKKYHYNFGGFELVSDSVSEEMLKNSFEEARKKVGGPYWKPQQKIIVELSRIAGAKFGMPPGVELSVTNRNTYDVLTTEQALNHELCHVIMAPHQKKWPNVLAEFFANSASPAETLKYSPQDTNNSAIRMINPAWASPTGGRNFFDDVRKLTSTAISKGLPDEQRRNIVAEAVKTGEIPFEQLDGFMQKFGISHEMFKKGTPGNHHAAFFGNNGNDKILLLVNYDTVRTNKDFDEIPGSATAKIVLHDKNGKLLSGEFGIPFMGLQIVHLENLVKKANSGVKVEDVALIELPEWGQKIKISQ